MSMARYALRTRSPHTQARRTCPGGLGRDGAVTDWVFGRLGSCTCALRAPEGCFVREARAKPIWSQFCTSRCCAATRA
eukprot:5663458-Prymnesium_polylepis.1